MAAPTPTSLPRQPDITKITVTGAENVRVGGTVQFKATASMSDGTSADVTSQAQWLTDSAATATADGPAVSGIGKGLVLVLARYQGVQGYKALFVLGPLLHDTLNEGLQNLTGEPSFEPAVGYGNFAFDDFVSPISGSLAGITFQGIRCGMTPMGLWLRFYRSNGDLPDRSSYQEVSLGSEARLAQTIDGTAERACPGNTPGTLITYRSTGDFGYTFSAGERSWVSIFAILPVTAGPVDQWQFRHGKVANGYAAAYRELNFYTGNFVRQPWDLAFSLE
jgi:hypothetical protein